MEETTVNHSMNEALPSVINDPFKKTKVKQIIVIGRESLFTPGKWIFNGDVEFKNELTSGKQEFTGKSFDEVVLKIKSMLDNLQ